MTNRPAPSPSSKQPIRTCVICRKSAPKSELLRFTWGGAGPVADPGQTAPGRGAYSCRGEQCRRQVYALRKKWPRMFRLG